MGNLNRRQDFDVKITDDSIILICVIRDEFLLLDYFIRHYVELGVTHFIFVDNGSADGTLDYLISRNDIQCQVYHTVDAYAENEYGLTWVNDILDNQCKNKWCLVVDVDELLMPKSGLNLVDIKNEMEKTNSNVLPTCLVDFYPENFDASEYKRGEPFYSHSNQYDMFTANDMLIYPGEGGELVVKGGVRHRVFGANREPVCLTKKSFFKYDFFDTHKLAVGMHWLLPHDFDANSDETWLTYTKWPDVNKHIKFYSKICVLGHFKFIKPNIYEFFNKRVERNQDWGNSDEYRNYVQKTTNSFYKEGVSTLYESSDKIYLDVINTIEQREITIIISAARHGSTTLCEKLNNLTCSVSLFEAFSKTQGRFYSTNYDNMEIHINKIISKHDWMNQKYISFKVFSDHAVKLKDLFQLNLPIQVIFLRRNYEDSYASLRTSYLTGNWGTTPNRQSTAVGMTDHKKDANEIPTFEKYKKQLERWFFSSLVEVRQYNIPYKEIWFSDLIQTDFDIRSFLVSTETKN